MEITLRIGKGHIPEDRNEARLKLMVKCLKEDFPGQPIKVIKAIRAVTDWGLLEAKQLYDSV